MKPLSKKLNTALAYEGDVCCVHWIETAPGTDVPYWSVDGETTDDSGEGSHCS